MHNENRENNEKRKTESFSFLKKNCKHIYHDKDTLVLKDFNNIFKKMMQKVPLNLIILKIIFIQCIF